MFLKQLPVLWDQDEARSGQGEQPLLLWLPQLPALSPEAGDASRVDTRGRWNGAQAIPDQITTAISQIGIAFGGCSSFPLLTSNSL